jgi:hypothetical protein
MLTTKLILCIDFVYIMQDIIVITFIAIRAVNAVPSRDYE